MSNDSDQPVERLANSLNSRKYKAAEEIRTPVRPQATDESDAAWHDPSLDAMLQERRVAPPQPSIVKKIFVISIIFFILAAGGAAYIFYDGSNFISSKNVDITVNGPVSVSAGDPVTLAISVNNKNNADLTSAVLTITYPDGTREASDTSQTLLRDTADFGVIAAGQNATKNVAASFFGETGTIETVDIRMDYTVRGSVATFTKDKTYDIALGNAPVSVNVTQPDTVSAGIPFTTSVTIVATAADVVRGVVLKADYPYGFKATSFNPAASTNDNFWSLGDLAPGAKKTIQITGVLSGVDNDQRTFRFEAGVPDPTNGSVLKTTLADTSHTIALQRPDLGVAISFEGSTDPTYSAPAGGTVSANIHFQNNSTSKLSNAKIVAKLTGAVDPTSVTPLTGGFYDSNTNSVTWDSSAQSTLASMNPGDTVDVSFSFKSLSASSGSKEIDISATGSGIPLGAGSNGALSTSDTAQVKIASEVALVARSVYSRGPFANTGPVPPKAASATTYTIYFDLGNTQNDVLNGKITGKLGPNVTWTNSMTSVGENVSYDQGSNTLTWDVGTLASGAGYTIKNREAIFQVSLTPSLGQLKSAPTLVSGITFTGTDSFTHTPVTIAVPSVTTLISSDPTYVQGDETVVK